MSAGEGPLTVNPWRRYGQHRVYVNDADGATVGWMDLKTGARNLRQPDRSDEFEQAVAEWLADAGESVPGMPDPDPAAGPPAPDAPPPAPAGGPPALDAPVPVGPATGSPPPRQAGRVARRLTHPVDVPPPAPPARPSTGSPEAESAEVDLATNRPGAQARARALEEQRRRPIVTGLARVFGIRTDERAWRIGEKGEVLVARQLDELGRRDPAWRFLHSLPVGRRGADLDHLVIGPGGVFCLNAKHHPDAAVWVAGNSFKVDGHYHPYVRNSRHEAQRVGRLLSQVVGAPVGVLGVIVVVKARSVTVRKQPEEVAVVPRMQIRDWLTRCARVLDDEAIERLYDAARRSTTWRG